MTDKISEDIYDEYQHRVGKTSVDSSPDAYMKAYPGGRVLVDQFVQALSNATGVPADVVWKGVVRSYFEGVDLTDASVQSLLVEHIPAELLNTLMNEREDTDITHSAVEEISKALDGSNTLIEKIGLALIGQLARSIERPLFAK